MTPPDGLSNRTIAGIAAALGITIGVAPTTLLAQDTTHTTAPAVSKDAVTGTAIEGVKQNKVKLSAADITIEGSKQGKFVAGTGANTPNAFTYNKATTSTAGGTPAGTLDKSSPTLYQQKVVAGSQTQAASTRIFMKMPTVGAAAPGQSTASTQAKTALPAVQQKEVPAVQQKATTSTPQ